MDDRVKWGSIMEKAHELAARVSGKRFTFFLGAGFSKNIHEMPDFYKLVRNDILPKYYKEIHHPDHIKKLLNKMEFRPQNCLHCFIESFCSIYGENEDWSIKIQQYQVKERRFTDHLQAFIMELWNEYNAQRRAWSDDPNRDQRLQQLRKANRYKIFLFLEELLHKWAPERPVALDLLDEPSENIEELCGKMEMFQERDLIYLRYLAEQVTFANRDGKRADQCAHCATDLWTGSREYIPYEPYFLLGLLQSFLDKRKYQIKDLLEYIYAEKGKYKIAQYIFANNPNFKVFPELIKLYYSNPGKVVGDSQIALARLAKEGLLNEIITTNWDDLMELACHAVGLYVKTSDNRTFGHAGEKWSPHIDLGSKIELKRYNNYAVAVSEQRDFYSSENPPTISRFYLYKIHGSIDTIIKAMSEKKVEMMKTETTMDCSTKYPKDLNVNLVITHRDLLDWRYDKWSEDLVNSILRSHEIIFSGISGQDNVIYATVRKLMEEVMRASVQSEQNYFDKDAVPDDPIIKRIFSVAVADELILSNMLTTDTTVIEATSLEIDLSTEYNHHKGVDLFFRWFYAYYILMTFKRNQTSYVRKAIAQICNSQCDEILYTWCIEKVEVFLDKLTNIVYKDREKQQQDKEEQQRKIFFLDIVYDVIPKLIHYTWLINRDLSTIFERIGGTNFLFKKPHFYLPVFYYLEEFTLYLILFAEIYEYLEKSLQKRHYQCTKDGVIVIDGVAMIILLQGKEENWGNFERFGVQRFSPETNALISRCNKVLVFHLVPNSSVQEGSAPNLLYSFAYQRVTLDNFRVRLAQELRRGRMFEDEL